MAAILSSSWGSTGHRSSPSRPWDGHHGEPHSQGEKLRHSAPPSHTVGGLCCTWSSGFPGKDRATPCPAWVPPSPGPGRHLCQAGLCSQTPESPGTFAAHCAGSPRSPQCTGPAAPPPRPLGVLGVHGRSHRPTMAPLWCGPGDPHPLPLRPTPPRVNEQDFQMTFSSP